ncbi:amino acid/polyamine/organocation transporter, APC superfamily [Asanoa ishikariensis]|uniref:Amino acid/polyamine/organocation transporter, APC superfamily n=1 Tax=Asanoa ishikariensis TaxID=137265 RepID=A0A1H3TTY5_9ACTN|nr:APC family permease [Asanoa ishikariensis]SDZ52789.1 amino acid/polyamine/organocation transporter, APC superfamily [Asanoa ishikariensis]
MSEQLAGTLARRRLGVVHLFFFVVAASAPLTVLGGGVTTTFAVTGSKGVPLSFLVLAVILGIFAVGYAAMSRHVANAGAFYSYIAQGIGRPAGVGGSFVALTAYNAIQVGLYGLFGYIFADFMTTKFDVTAKWWVWALMAWVLIGILGMLRVDLNASVLAVLLVLEIIATAVFDIVGLGNPAGGSVSMAGWDFGNLFAGGVGAVFALGIAAFTGFESGAIYSEEVKDPRHTVARATFLAVLFTGIFYAISAWAMTVAVGPDNVQQAATEAGPGVVFGTLAEHTNNTVADIAVVLFFTSVFAALLSFHNGVARYLFALGRERVLPQFLGRTSRRTMAPIAGSLTQTVIAIVVLVGFIAAGKDPLLDLFTWLSGVSAVGVVLLMASTSAAVVGYFRVRRADESLWQGTVAPLAATILLGALLVTLVVNFNSLLAPTNPSYLRYLLPGLIAVAALIGVIWGLILKSSRPDVYEGIGRTVGQPLTADESGKSDSDYVPVH